ncbi:MAG: malto-oligosyltrehalose synthase [Rhodospirillales bacterium]|nr:malto-oligosyltrehalose synthase [Rhodospirillales bacterium]
MVTQVPSVPRATYRLQFNRDFGFADAEAVVSYLARLGISHVYASPYLKARAGSTHGYDITDHNAFNPEIGDESAFVSFSDALGAEGMGQILDFVPNHMGISHDDNVWWLDVLEWGEESPYAQYFDIDWSAVKVELSDKVLLPVLGDHYGRVLEAGELKLGFDAGTGSFSVWYYDHRFPVTPGTYPRILRGVMTEYVRVGGDDSATIIELEDLLVGFRDVGNWTPAMGSASMRRAEADRLKARLVDLVNRTPSVAEIMSIALARLNGKAGDPESLVAVHELLEAQNYRLAYWRVAAEEINYRRFFQINELAGIRVELPAVFEDAHRLVLSLIGQGRIHGLRIDHIDGLFDPKQYLDRLQQAARAALSGEGGGSDDSATGLFYVVVEKILAGHEWLREEWPIAGTTGYEFLNRVNGLFVEPRGERLLQRIYERFLGKRVSFESTAYNGKLQVMEFELASELRVLANEYDRLTESSWLTRDYTLVGLRQALRQVVASFPVYRTYVDANGAAASDRRDIDWAIAHARRSSLRADKTVFDFIDAALTTDLSSGPSPYNRREVRRLAMKFQQYTGPVAAKGVEDTAFYRFNRLISLNEVGGEPTRFGMTVSAFHKMTQDSARRWPHAMLSTATHDTKRGEDARVRIDVLSEMPAEWGRRVRRWAMINRRRKAVVNDEPAPTANDEYLFYQALVGVWPAEFHDAEGIDPTIIEDLKERLCTYMTKAVREAKTHSSWINPNNEYEDALLSLVRRCLDITRPNPFLADFGDFHRRVALIGMVNSLAQTVLKLTAPGVPDVYQGCEFWDFSLVDPDNRRPIDFAERQRRLCALEDARAQGEDGTAARLLASWPDGMVKLFVTWRLLTLRRERPEVFTDSTYDPLDVTGEHAEHVCAFVREVPSERILVVVPRLGHRLLGAGNDALPLGPDVWAGTALVLPEAGALPWTDVLTDRTMTPITSEEGGTLLEMRTILAAFPVAVLRQAIDASTTP